MVLSRPMGGLLMKEPENEMRAYRSTADKRALNCPVVPLEIGDS